MFYVKTAYLEPAPHLGGLKPEPEIGQLAQAFVLVPCQVDDVQLTALPERPMGLFHGDSGYRYVVQDHTGHHRVRLPIAHRQVFEITESEVTTVDIGAGRDTRQVEHG